MSNINLYTLSNKIRTLLLTTIDKEMQKNSKNNNLLLNSQNQEQLMQKFLICQDHTIESEESFEILQSSEDNSIFFELSCNHSDNKLCFFEHSSRTSNKSLFAKNFITKSLSPK